MTHGWPGSVIELLEAVGPLTDPTAHGGRAEDAFDLVLPSLPGYGFSGEPTEIGWDLGRIARAWAELMNRLGYTRYVAQGGDLGAVVTDAMGRQAPEGLLGIHMNLLVTALAGGPMPAEYRGGTRGARRDSRRSGRAASATSWSRPRGRRRSATPCWIPPSPWRPGCSTTTRTAYYKISRAFVDGQPSGNLTRDHILDNITLYWLTGTGASAARSYWENGRAQAALAAGQAPPRSRSRSASPRSPARSSAAPRSWVEKAYPTLTYFNEVDKGGHFAAWEEPELFSMRSGRRSSRCASSAVMETERAHTRSRRIRTGAVAPVRRHLPRCRRTLPRRSAWSRPVPRFRPAADREAQQVPHRSRCGRARPGRSEPRTGQPGCGTEVRALRGSR